MFTNQIIDNEKHFQSYLDIRKIQPSTQECYLRYYRLFKPVVEGLGLSQEVVEEWLLQHKNHKQIRAFITNYLDFLDNREIRLRRIAGRTPVKKRTLITPNDADKIIAYCIEHKLKFGVLLAIIFDVGLRRAEALNIYPEDFEWDKWFENKEMRCKLKIKGKGDKERFVMVSPAIMSLIQYYANTYPIDEGHPLIKTNRSSLTTAFHKSSELLFGKRYRLHDLRRSRATEWFSKGKTLDQIKIRLGHDSIKTTELYVEPDVSKELRAWENE